MQATILHKDGTTEQVEMPKHVTEFTCDKCGLPKRHESEISTGYGHVTVNGKEEKHCFECCGKADAEALRTLKPKETYTLYLTGTSPDYRVSNWPGTLNVPVMRHSYSRNGGGFNGQRTDVWFRYEGNEYHGINRGDTQILRIKKLKNKF